MRAEAEKTSQGAPSTVCTLKTPNKAPQDVKDKYVSTLCSASWVERTGALTVGRGYSVAFASGRQSGSLITFPPLSEPGRFSRISALQWAGTRSPLASVDDSHGFGTRIHVRAC